MMLSRTGRDRDPLSVAVRPVRAGGHHGDVPRVRPTGGLHLLLLLLLLLRCAVLCCAVLCCAVLRCAVLCCAVLCAYSGGCASLSLFP